MSVLCLLAGIAAFALFGLASDQHHPRRFGHRAEPLRKRRMRAAAWACVLLCFPLAVAAQGWIYGPIYFFGALMLGAGMSFLALNFLPGAKDAAKRRH